MAGGFGRTVELGQGCVHRRARGRGRATRDWNGDIGGQVLVFLSGVAVRWHPTRKQPRVPRLFIFIGRSCILYPSPAPAARCAGKYTGGTLTRFFRGMSYNKLIILAVPRAARRLSRAMRRGHREIWSYGSGVLRGNYSAWDVLRGGLRIIVVLGEVSG